MNTSATSTVRIYRVLTHVMKSNRQHPEGAADFYRSEEHDRHFTANLEEAKSEFNMRWSTYRNEGRDGDAVEYELTYADIELEEGEDTSDAIRSLYTYASPRIKWATLEDAGCPSGDASWNAFHMNTSA
jgi:hypothetical protein